MPKKEPVTVKNRVENFFHGTRDRVGRNRLASQTASGKNDWFIYDERRGSSLVEGKKWSKKDCDKLRENVLNRKNAALNLRDRYQNGTSVASSSLQSSIEALDAITSIHSIAEVASYAGGNGGCILVEHRLIFDCPELWWYIR